MKIALKLLLCYLLASLVAASLSLALQPPHAHIPSLVILAFFPFHPAIWVRDVVQGNISFANALCLGLVIVSMGSAVCYYRRQRARAAA
jgi:hypothetical protein